MYWSLACAFVGLPPEELEHKLEETLGWSAGAEPVEAAAHLMVVCVWPDVGVDARTGRWARNGVVEEGSGT